MENVEGELGKLLARKFLAQKPDWQPQPKDQLEILLAYVYRQVLRPAHYQLTEQAELASSTLAWDTQVGFGDVMGDGMGGRPRAVLHIICQGQPLFAYYLSFDGDNESHGATLWRKVAILLDSEFDLVKPTTQANEEPLTETSADDTASASITEYVNFHTLDVHEAMRLVQADLAAVCHTLL